MLHKSSALSHKSNALSHESPPNSPGRHSRCPPFCRKAQSEHPLHTAPVAGVWWHTTPYPLKPSSRLRGTQHLPAWRLKPQPLLGTRRCPSSSLCWKADVCPRGPGRVGSLADSTTAPTPHPRRARQCPTRTRSHSPALLCRLVEGQNPGRSTHK